MTTDVFDILDTRLSAIAERVGRDVAARLAAGVPVTSMRGGVVVIERLGLAVEPLPRLSNEDFVESAAPSRITVSG